MNQVPMAVTSPVRAGTPLGLFGCFCNSFNRASLGCKGHSFASLLDPLPFPLSRPSARLQLTGPGRSLSLTKGQGQGLRPLHPARCGSPAAVAAESWPLSTNPSSAATQGGVADDFLECLARGAFYSCSHDSYDCEEIQNRSRGCVCSAETCFASAVFSESGVRRDSSSGRDDFSFRLFLRIDFWAVPLKTAQPFVTFAARTILLRMLHSFNHSTIACLTGDVQRKCLV